MKMKRRVFSLLLCIVMMLSLLPTMAWAAEEGTYNVWVGDRQVTSANKGDVLGDGKVSFEVVDGTPTLTIAEGANITGSHEYSVICAEGTDLVINAPVDLTMENTQYYGVLIKGEGNLTVNGNVNITVSGDDYTAAIYVQNGSVTINGDATVHSGDGFVGGYAAIYAEKDILVTGDVNIDGFTHGLYVDGKITVNGDANIQAAQGGLYGNGCENGDITVGRDVNIIISKDWSAIYANGGSVTIGGDAYIRYNGTAESSEEAFYVNNNITVEGDVDIDGFEEGMYCNGDITIEGNAIVKATKRGLYSNYGDINIGSGKWDITGTNKCAIEADKDIVIPETHTITTPEGGIVKYGKIYEADGKTVAKHVVIEPKAPAAETYGVWVNGEQFTSEKLEIACGTGKATYDPDTATLTLDGAQITKVHDYAAIESDHELTVNVFSSSSIDMSSTDACGIYVDNGDLTLNLNGGLTVVSNTYAIEAYDNITVSGRGKLDLTTTGYGSNAIDAGENVTISGDGDVTIVAEGTAIKASNSVTISGSGNVNLTTTGTNGNGISAYENGVTLANSGKVTINAYACGIDSYGNVTISGNGEISIVSVDAGIRMFNMDDKVLLNGTGSPISIEGKIPVYNWLTKENPVEGTNFDKYEVSAGRINMGHVEFTLKCTHPNSANREIRFAEPAGCETEGYTGDTYCTDCGELIEEGTIISANHKGDDVDFCEECGLCYGCGGMCSEGTDHACLACHESWDVMYCPDCFKCYDAHDDEFCYGGCGYCNECGSSPCCEDCGYHIDCADSTNSHCGGCGKC